MGRVQEELTISQRGSQHVSHIDYRVFEALVATETLHQRRRKQNEMEDDSQTSGVLQTRNELAELPSNTYVMRFNKKSGWL